MNSIHLLLLSLSAASAIAAPVRKLVPVVTAGVEKPTDLQVAPGEPAKLYVVLQRGRIVVVENGKAAKTPFLDVESKIISGGEMGLLGLAFHPKYAENKRYFVNYTAERPGLVTVIAE